jgi:NAD(P)-dependent dehydrogenase (short-subunit alcohol dehydrogenase family)
MTHPGHRHGSGSAGGPQGKVTVITGASRGIGRAIACRLAKAGDHVVGFARDASELQRTRDLIEPAGGVFTPWVVDVTDSQAVAKAMAEVTDQFDVLVNNAAACLRGTLTELTAENYDSMIMANVNSVVYCCRSAWEPMRGQGGGVIINVSSLSAAVSSPGFSVYGATKGFVNTLTVALAAEGRKLGIRVHAVAPGYVRTDLLERVAPEITADKALDPDDVAVAVQALCGAAHRYSSGEVYYLRR